MKKLLLILLISAITLPVKAQEKNNIDYDSVREALTDMIANNSDNMTLQNEWTVFINNSETQKIIWSFTPPSHYAYPALAKRELLEGTDGQYMETSILCEADQESCDQLQKDFQLLDSQFVKQ